METAGVRYIESSALVAALLEHDSDALKSVRTQGRKVTSALTIAETARAILRARAVARLTADEERAAVRALRRFERRCYLVVCPRNDLAVARTWPNGSSNGDSGPNRRNASLLPSRCHRRGSRSRPQTVSGRADSYARRGALGDNGVAR